MTETLVAHGDCLNVLRTMPDNSVHSIVTDPPYGLAAHKSESVAAALTAWVSGDREQVPNGKGFMGREWDAFVPPPAVFDECLRVLKPGGHVLVFAGSRTVDLMGLSIRLAGFEIRDTISWLYGSGFPKSMNVGKAAGVEWEGWGTALKPAQEPIIVARKPLVGTVAANVLEHGTGGINIDGCRVGSGGQLKWSKPRDMGYHGGTDVTGAAATENAQGRFPANVLLSHAVSADGGGACASGCVEGCPVDELDRQSGTVRSSGVYGGDGSRKPGDHSTNFGGGHRPATMYGDSGGASRFFPTFRYQAKAPTRERPKVDGVSHPTVKPLELMRWLVRLVTPPGGTVLDPFAGSGTTLQAAREEGFDSIGIERQSEYLPLINKRLDEAA